MGLCTPAWSRGKEDTEAGPVNPMGGTRGRPEGTCSLAVQVGLSTGLVSEGTAGIHRPCARTLGGHALSLPPTLAACTGPPVGHAQAHAAVCVHSTRPGLQHSGLTCHPSCVRATWTGTQLSVPHSCMLKEGGPERNGGLPPRAGGPAEAFSRVPKVQGVVVWPPSSPITESRPVMKRVLVTVASPPQPAPRCRLHDF